MKGESCVACGRFISQHEREGRIRDRASFLVNRASYPVIYRLLKGLMLCGSCLEEMPFIGEEVCLVCGRDMKSEIRKYNGRCRDCVNNVHEEGIDLKANRSLLCYDDKGKQLLGIFKYRGDESLATYFGALLAIAIHRYYSHMKFSCITTVPLHPQRLKERGFNQVDLLARYLEGVIHVPVRTLLLRIKDTPKLSKQSGRVARLESMREAFAWTGDSGVPCVTDNSRIPCHFVASFFGKKNILESRVADVGLVCHNPPLKILLIDDIYTTGSTLRSCAKILRTHLGRKCEIYSLTIFR
ncbi:ComF family protein [Brevibacillus brevis]|uniref:ComF family protein n=1 Tax=Brevibacillus brevis TaxID=1393 RepID=UPI0025A620BC|nr:ComF family protein [Brevibacillus brevis]WJQ81132.1 ComF family protein [Brevibacillus brevis]